MPAARLIEAVEVIKEAGFGWATALSSQLPLLLLDDCIPCSRRIFR